MSELGLDLQYAAQLLAGRPGPGLIGESFIGNDLQRQRWSWATTFGCCWAIDYELRLAALRGSARPALKVFAFDYAGPGAGCVVGRPGRSSHQPGREATRLKSNYASPACTLRPAVDIART